MTIAPGSRVVPGRGTPGKELKEEESKGFRMLGHCDFGGDNKGDVMQLLVKGNYLLCGHVGSSGSGTSIVDISDPRKPHLVNQIPAPPNTHTNKVQIAGDILIVNNEQFGGRERLPFKAGIDIYDLSRLPEIRLLSFFHVGGRGVHRFWFADGKYAYLTAGDDEYIDQFLKIIDVSDPLHPKEAGRWALPGMRINEKQDWVQAGQFPEEFKKKPDGTYETLDEKPVEMDMRRVCVHNSIGVGDRIYGAWWDSGFIILDQSDIFNPKLISHTRWPAEESAATHSVLPLLNRNLCVVSDECTASDCVDILKQVRVMDISDEKNPKVLSILPYPEGDYLERGGRSGPHNIHENRPDSYISDRRIYHTWFNAGLRVFDIEDSYNPKEIACYVPATPRTKPLSLAGGRFEVLQTQVDDVFVAKDELVYISDRLGAGVWILEPNF